MALEAGMSYGKWKAMQNPVTIEKKKLPIGIETDRCGYCGIEFYRSYSRMKFCSKRCRQLARNERQVQKYREKSQEVIENGVLEV